MQARNVVVAVDALSLEPRVKALAVMVRIHEYAVEWGGARRGEAWKAMRRGPSQNGFLAVQM